MKTTCYAAARDLRSTYTPGPEGCRNLPAVLDDPLEVEGDRGSHLALDGLERLTGRDAPGQIGRPGRVVRGWTALDQDQIALRLFVVVVHCFNPA